MLGFYRKTILIFAALAVLTLVYFYAHYGFASITAHVTAMFIPFLAVTIAAALGIVTFHAQTPQTPAQPPARGQARDAGRLRQASRC